MVVNNLGNPITFVHVNFVWHNAKKFDDINKAKWQRSTAFEDCVKTGEGWTRISVEPNEDGELILPLDCILIPLAASLPPPPNILSLGEKSSPDLESISGMPACDMDGEENITAA